MTPPGYSGQELRTDPLKRREHMEWNEAKLKAIFDSKLEILRAVDNGEVILSPHYLKI